MRNGHIHGISVDIEEIRRFRKIADDGLFLSRVFTPREIAYCRRFSSPESHFAARFAGKEAILKALGMKKGSVMPKEIEILNKKNGAPFINIRKADLKRDFSYLISLSHSST